MTMTATQPMTHERLDAIRRERCEHVNALLEVVKAHGRQFFAKTGGRTHDARMFIDDRERIRFIDEYSGKAVLVTKDPNSRQMCALSHGSGLRWFVSYLGEYVRDGVQVSASMIGMYWGYSDDAIAAVRDAAVRLGIAFRHEESVA